MTGAAGPAAPLRIAEVAAFVFRAPIARPVTTSFGVMRDRPMVLVRVVDPDGNAGWGEVWCNFPGCGAEHRARLVETVLRPLLVGRDFAGPEALFAEMTRATRVLAIQSGEPGPLAQCIAGLDIAAWDLAARRAGAPLWRLLGGRERQLRVYASGLSPDEAVVLGRQRLAEGYRAFKLKVGFGPERDLAALDRLRSALGANCAVMVDANQAWDVDAAIRMLPQLGPFGLGWIEEPIPADHPWADWSALARHSPAPLAAGENLAGEAAFEGAVRAGALGVLQPDLAKWGGFSGCLPVARRALAAGLRFCPHYLGGGVGLVAAAHLLAAAGGGGMLEVDANPNPLRTLLMGPLARVEDGVSSLSDEPGLGIVPDLEALDEFRVRGDGAAGRNG